MRVTALQQVGGSGCSPTGRWALGLTISQSVLLQADEVIQ
jgi:hypothetical protein